MNVISHKDQYDSLHEDASTSQESGMLFGLETKYHKRARDEIFACHTTVELNLKPIQLCDWKELWYPKIFMDLCKDK